LKAKKIVFQFFVLKSKEPSIKDVRSQEWKGFVQCG